MPSNEHSMNHPPVEQIKKKKSRDAARQRRGQQNDEFGELASQLPLSTSVTEKLDRLCIMRLSNSYIKIKHVLQQITASSSLCKTKKISKDFNSCIQDALGGFIFVLAEDGQCLYMSPNVTECLGLPQLEVTGHSIYKYVHSCDQDVLAKQLGGQVPLEDMEIFDGLFCSDTVHCVKNPKQATSPELENSPHRSFFLRMKSTLTSRGKSVNLNASIYRVVHCTGTMQMYRTKLGTSDSSMTRCLIAVGTPLLSNMNFEVPADRQTFITKHTLDMKVIECEDIASDVLGYRSQSMVGSSWYLFTHICDANVIKTCHDILLKKGQAVSGYYRVLAKNGGWVWMQTKANVVYLSTTGQPQYIMCIHYVISGLELDDQILSTEQLTVTSSGKKPCSKHKKVITAAGTPLKYMKTSVISKDETIEPVSYSKVQNTIEFDNVINGEDLLQDFDDADLPGLEFLDVADGFAGVSDDMFSSRSPFIPPPFIDSKLSTEVDSNEEIPESELLNRAPYIPPPFIDEIICFDDLSMPDLTDNLLDMTDALGNIPSSQAIPCSASSVPTSSLATAMNQLYDLGKARVPMELISQYLVPPGKKDCHKAAGNPMVYASG